MPIATSASTVTSATGNNVLQPLHRNNDTAHYDALKGAGTLVRPPGASTPLRKLENVTEPVHCASCHNKIVDRFLLEAIGKYWHENCLRCTCCQCRLGEVGSSLYCKQDMLLCRRDYLRMFGATGICAACNKNIPAFEMVMRARHNVYHLECFACQECQSRFCVGDKFYLCDGRILCQYDYDERVAFAQLGQQYQTNNNMALNSEPNKILSAPNDGSLPYAMAASIASR